MRFGSIELTPLQYNVYLPYVIVTEALIPLSAHLLLVGIFNSVKNICGDVKLGKACYKSAASELTLLMTPCAADGKGVREENKSVEKRSGLSEATNDLHLEEEIKEEDVKKAQMTY